MLRGHNQLCMSNFYGIYIKFSKMRGICACNRLAFRKVTHILFDMDGVLLDTETAYTLATNNVVKKYGKIYDWSIKPHLMGLTPEETFKAIVNLLGLPLTWQEYSVLAEEQFDLLMPHCKLMPGVEKLVKHLFNNNVPTAVATSSTRKNVDLKIAKHKHVFDLFHHIVSGGSDPEVKFGKPNPAIFLVCASRFPDKPKPEQCLVVEDAPNGVAAAINAGMQCIMVPDVNLPPAMTTAATKVITSLEKIKLEDFGLPPFTNS